MKKILTSKIKFIVLGLFLIMTIIAGILSFKVEVNYDLTKYLPEDSNTKRALEIMVEEFGSFAGVELMVEMPDPNGIKNIKEEIQKVRGVSRVVAYDDISLLSSFISDPVLSDQMKESMYKDNNALLMIVIEGDSSSKEVEKTIDNIRDLAILKDKNFSMRGEALYNIESRKILSNEILKIMLVIVPLIILILLFASKSWIEPLIILLNLGIAIALNMGTNLIFKEVSYITQSLAMAFQLAISLDYSLFLIHRYYEEKDKEEDTPRAITSAWKTTIGSITGSALTTTVGFVALLFMQYTIGSDIGLVMGKGIVFSFLTTIVLMPILIWMFSPLINKTMKKSNKTLNVNKVAKVFYQKRYLTLAVFLVLAVLGFVFQNDSKFLYATSEATDKDSRLVIEEENIKKVFGVNQQIVLLIPNGDSTKELQLYGELSLNEHIKSIDSIITYQPILNIPFNFLDEIKVQIRAQFIGPNYSRMVLSTTIDKESEEMYQFSENLKATVAKYYDEYYLAGLATSTTEIKDVVTDDTLVVTLVSIIGVGLVILLIFKSLSLPLLLLLVIQSSIWLNMSFVALRGVSVIYIGYLVLQTIQLGATIDYAVLMTSRYQEFRKMQSLKDAISNTLKSSGISVIISALVLAVAGYGEGLMSRIPAVQEIGILIGRGALISGILVIFVLPSILIIFDKIIMKTTLKANYFVETGATESETNES